MKFSFDFPEPAVVFGDHRFSVLVFTDENTYGLDRSRMRAAGTGDALQLTCDGFVWAGGQERIDAYFLDIVGGHVNSTTGDMHEGTKRLVENLRAKYPRVACVGEMPYDALHSFIPMYHAGGGQLWRKYSRFFQHLSAPGPGRGSSGVHEWGFSRFNQETFGLSPTAIPTLQVVDDTFTKYRDTMDAIIARARARASL